MKKILLASLAAVSCVLANYTPNPQLDIQYPFVMWSKTAIPEFSENANQITAAFLADQIHSTVYNQDGTLKATRLFILRKNGFTTRDALKSAKYFEYDREVMFHHSIAFPWVETEGCTSANDAIISQSLGVTAKEYQLDAATEIPVLAEQLASDTSATLQLNIVNIKQSLGNELLNEVSMQIQEAVIKTGAVSSYIMAIAGRQSDASEEADPIISLQQTEVIATQESGTPRKLAAAPGVGVKGYINSSILTGIFIGLLMVFFMLVGFLQLMEV
jgi:hypothetical protein